MTRKITAYYAEKTENTDSVSEILYVEIGAKEIVCLIKASESQLIAGFEYFLIEKPDKGWSDIFEDLISKSLLLNKSYLETHCIYNFEEAVIIPKEKFIAGSAEDYLSLLYGENNECDMKFDSLTPIAEINIAFRIDKLLTDCLNKKFVLYKSNHVYYKILKDILIRKENEPHFVKIKLYNTHMIIAILKGGILQIIQSFTYEKTEDILYHLINCCKQFEVNVLIAELEISGFLDDNSILLAQLQNYFGKTTLEQMPLTGVFENRDDYPPHTFTHYSKLVL